MAATLKPPDDLPGAALDEWKRIISAARRAGRPLKSADRSVLVLYIRTWMVNSDATKRVQDDGAIAVYSNGNKGPSPQYRIMLDTGKQLRQLLADLGMTPAARKFDIVSQKSRPEPAPLDF